jgi:hypothetical protein
MSNINNEKLKLLSIINPYSILTIVGRLPKIVHEVKVKLSL